MSRKKVKITSQEAAMHFELMQKEVVLRTLAEELLEKRAQLEQQRMKWWEQIREKYGLEKGKCYVVSHALQEIEEVEDGEDFVLEEELGLLKEEEKEINEMYGHRAQTPEEEYLEVQDTLQHFEELQRQRKEGNDPE